jgi:hypothetical protein
MRGVRVKTVGDTGGVLRVSVLFSFIERTSIEAAEQAPHKSGARAGGRSDGRSRTGRVAHRSPTRAGGFVFAEPDGSRATSIRAGGDAPDTRDIFVKPGSERPFYTTVHREPSTM